MLAFGGVIQFPLSGFKYFAYIQGNNSRTEFRERSILKMKQFSYIN